MKHERIWASPPTTGPHDNGIYTSDPRRLLPQATEYVRADLYEKLQQSHRALEVEKRGWEAKAREYRPKLAKAREALRSIRGLDHDNCALSDCAVCIARAALKEIGGE